MGSVWKNIFLLVSITIITGSCERFEQYGFIEGQPDEIKVRVQASSRPNFTWSRGDGNQLTQGYTKKIQELNGPCITAADLNLAPTKGGRCWQATLHIHKVSDEDLRSEFVLTASVGDSINRSIVIKLLPSLWRDVPPHGKAMVIGCLLILLIEIVVVNVCLILLAMILIFHCCTAHQIQRRATTEATDSYKNKQAVPSVSRLSHILSSSHRITQAMNLAKRRPLPALPVDSTYLRMSNKFERNQRRGRPFE